VVERAERRPAADPVTDARRRRLDAGTLLRHEGDGTAHLDLVVSGLVRAFVTAPDGRRMTVRYLRSGGLVGAASLFASPFALPVTIQAVTDTEPVSLSPDPPLGLLMSPGSAE
jgi:CRP/FNR family transcriptional regulator, cyclic AMP receptor protein